MEAITTMDPDTFLNDLLLSEAQSDVRVIVEKKMDKCNFPAHSFVLKRRSPVIATMLESDFVEGQTHTILITDFKPIHIEMFLRFLYTDILPGTYTGLCKLVKIADKYLVSELTEKCEESLIDDVDFTNVYELCQLADLYSLNELCEQCLFLIRRAAFKLLNFDDIKCLSKELMEDIVRADDLNVTKEINVFWAIWRWGNLKFRYLGVAFSNEDVRKFVKDLLKHVRWSLTDNMDEEKMISLGITVDEADLQKECQPRTPSISPDIIWFFNQCDVLCVYNYASASMLLKQHFDPLSDEVHLMRAVSLSKMPFYVVGVVLYACSKEPFRGKITCTCGSSCSFAEIPKQSDKILPVTENTELTVINYQQLMYEFKNPIEVCHNENFVISMNNSSKFGSVRLKIRGEVMRSKDGKKLFVYGSVRGIKKVFLL